MTDGLLAVWVTRRWARHVPTEAGQEETEAYYLGDLRAIRSAYPQADMVKAEAYEPDSIVGTAELFGEIIGDDGLRKVEWAATMGSKVTTNPRKSRSPSFRALHQGIESLVRPAPIPPRKPRKKHWKSRHSAIRKQSKPKRSR